MLERSGRGWFREFHRFRTPLLGGVAWERMLNWKTLSAQRTGIQPRVPEGGACADRRHSSAAIPCWTAAAAVWVTRKWGRREITRNAPSEGAEGRKSKARAGAPSHAWSCAGSQRERRAG